MLAVAMIVSLASVAMAKTDPEITSNMTDDTFALNAAGLVGVTSYDENPTVKVDEGRAYFPVVNLVGPFSFDADDKALYNASTTLGKTSTADGDAENDKEIKRGPIEYGDTAYFALVQFMPDAVTSQMSNNKLANDDLDGYVISDSEDGYFSLVQDSETVSGLKIKADWEEGGDMVKKISIVKRKIDNNEDKHYLEDSSVDYDDPNVYYPTAEELGLLELGYEEGDYYYFLCIAYEDSTTVNDTDIMGTLTINKGKDPSVDSMEIDIETTLDWENSWRNLNKIKTDATTGASTKYSEFNVTGDIELDVDTNYALKFDYDDEIEITFEDDSYFNVDVSGQGKIMFNYNTDPINKVANKYYMAELNFWNGNGAKFNRVGEFFLSCEDLEGNQFLYQVNANGTLSEVPGAEYDESDEGFYFNTRTLGSYVVSDMELDIAPVVSAPSVSAPVVSAPVISNPSTGAAE